MSSFNKVILMGNLTRDPELRSTPGGAQVTEITLAVNDVYTDKQGNRQERTDFIYVTFWGKQAETLTRWKKKGDPLLIEGRLRVDQWDDKETGKKRSALKVQGIGFTFLGRGGGGDGGGGGGGGRSGQGKGGSSRAPARDDGPPEGSYDERYATDLPPGGEEPPF
ncbi:MAG: single-stranded DNA-binding protein [Planctomycetes bacterium]|jgi:single-strand DNA-binding protein|nr:single-stranded DNA-binding protein [Planctomycetota bacterium]